MRNLLLIAMLALSSGNLWAMLPDSFESQTAADSEYSVDVECEADDPACVG